MIKLDVMIDEIKNAKTLGELYMIENLFKKDYEHMDKVNFEMAWLKRFQELVPRTNYNN